MDNKTIISFGSEQLEEFNIPKGQRGRVFIYTHLEDEEARDLMFNTPSIGRGFCSSYPYDEYTFFFDLSCGYTYDEMMKLKKEA